MRNVAQAILMLSLATTLCCLQSRTEIQPSELDVRQVIGRYLKCDNINPCPPQCVPPTSCITTFVQGILTGCQKGQGGAAGASGAGQVGTCKSAILKNTCPVISSPCGMPASPNCMVVNGLCVAVCDAQFGPPPPGC